MRTGARNGTRTRRARRRMISSSMNMRIKMTMTIRMYCRRARPKNCYNCKHLDTKQLNVKNYAKQEVRCEFYLFMWIPCNPCCHSTTLIQQFNSLVPDLHQSYAIHYVNACFPDADKLQLETIRWQMAARHEILLDDSQKDSGVMAT